MGHNRLLRHVWLNPLDRYGRKNSSVLTSLQLSDVMHNVGKGLC